jgi:hypothetical protein
MADTRMGLDTSRILAGDAAAMQCNTNQPDIILNCCQQAATCADNNGATAGVTAFDCTLYSGYRAKANSGVSVIEAKTPTQQRDICCELVSVVHRTSSWPHRMRIEHYTAACQLSAACHVQDAANCLLLRWNNQAAM